MARFEDDEKYDMLYKSEFLNTFDHPLLMESKMETKITTKITTKKALVAFLHKIKCLHSFNEFIVNKKKKPMHNLYVFRHSLFFSFLFFPFLFLNLSNRVFFLNCSCFGGRCWCWKNKHPQSIPNGARRL